MVVSAPGATVPRLISRTFQASKIGGKQSGKGDKATAKKG